ncbi:AraC family transcriptional regulator [Acidithiobacillus thiooxidans]|uniref:AraC family transcriptional regulator n=2 Tax=Acidithiobacillus TaxID=119977 RepID=UPI0028617B87|nr:AraC family transcriptional regulator [Acidithiobacillus thiooxidans]MDR7925754.1 AraC family transcriptional regulator [Acidithiobacillus thiooxidans]
MTERRAKVYAARFERLLDYIDRNLDQTLSVDVLSRYANFSRFHFQRQFSHFVGLSVYRYVQMLRLRRASYQLAFDPHRRVIDIALEAGFENPESFSRAFKNCFGQTPSQFRDQPAWQPWAERMQLPGRKRSTSMEVKVVDFSEAMVAVLEHKGPPDLIFESVQIFIEWRKSSGLSPVATSRTFGLAYSDPASTAPEEFRFDICGEIGTPVPDNPQGIITKHIPAGRYATVCHQGSTDRISDSAYYLYREWLPGSGEELRDFPLFFHYIKRIPDTSEHEQITDIYLPLK